MLLNTGLWSSFVTRLTQLYQGQILTAQRPFMQQCLPHTFLPHDLFGTELIDIQASLVTNQPVEILQGIYTSHHAHVVSEFSYCNVTITYTHPGQNDELNVQVWLPTNNWNGKLQGSGGGGYQTGLVIPAMQAAVADGFAVTSTDGGHTTTVRDPSGWALISPGNVNLVAIQNFASVSLNEAAVIGKSVTETFYGKPPSYSYWNGCSTGGRQGLMLAQRYPSAYDGILAAAPAINWPTFIISEYWPQLIMNELKMYPHPCELRALTAAAISHCDEQDGVKDGILSQPHLCDFNPHSLIGTQTPACPEIANNQPLTITKAAATIAQAAWTEARHTNGQILYPGLSHEAPLAGDFTLANTKCNAIDGSNCTAAPFPIALSWMKLFVEQGDPDFKPEELTRASFARLMHKSAQIYNSTIGTADPDLSDFKARGGKMITWHGLVDQVIFPAGTRNYYDAVKSADGDVEDYYRLFEAPGVMHCADGPGPYPGGAFEALINWVENEVAPEVLQGKSLPDKEGRVWERDLCKYPKHSQWKGTGEGRYAVDWECV